MPDPESQVIEWMTRVFDAATRGPSLFDPACFEGLHRAVAERVGQDRFTLVLREKSAPVFRLAARAGTQSAYALRQQPGGVYASPTRAFEDLLLSGETALIDEVADRPDLFGPEARATTLRSYAVLRVPLEGDDLCAWLLVGWHEPRRATLGPARELQRVAHLLRALIPAAHHAARAERFARMLDRLPHGVAGLDPEGRLLEVNRAAAALLRKPPVGTPFESLLSPEDRPRLQEILRAGGGTALLRLLTPEGVCPLDAIVQRVDEPGPLATQLHLEDATARLANEGELRARAHALSFLRELAETAAGELDAGHAIGRAAQLVTERLPVACAVVARVERATGRLERVADTGAPAPLVEALFALTAEELDRSCASGVLAVPAALARHGGEGRALTLVPLCHADQLVGVALFVTRGEPDERTRELLLASARTVAVALHAGLEYAEAVRLAAERRQLLDSLPSIVFRLDPATGATLYANAAVERVLGVPVSSALGLPGLEGLLCDESERETAAEARAAVAAGGESAWVDQRYRRRDGRTVTLRARLYRVSPGSPGAAPGAVGRAVIEGVAQDVTDEIDARKQLVHADRLRSLGMLAAGVAHEINNPAAFILLGVQQLGRMLAQMPDDPAGSQTRKRANEVLGELSDGIQRIVHIVGELKLFTRIPESAFSTPVDVNRLIASAVTLAQAELRRRARVEVDLGDLPPLPGDHARLGQVFVNLLINAAQAIPPGNEEANLVRVCTRSSGQEICVEVSDTGVGIEPANLTRIFDPFFTTKAPGEGTGLGLAISYDLVRRAGGTIEVESAVGRGTTFVVRLPVRSAGRARESKPQVTPVPVGARVLIVEDEQHLAVAVARALASTYMVELAQDAAAALEMFERDGGAEFSAVLCDLRLPGGVDGVTLYERARARWPALGERFVFLTGLGLSAEFESFVRTTHRPVLEKPFEMSELEDVVARVVGAGR